MRARFVYWERTRSGPSGVSGAGCCTLGFGIGGWVAIGTLGWVDRRGRDSRALRLSVSSARSHGCACRRPLCTYVVTHRRGPTIVHCRYYRCRSAAGGRPPCRGIQVAAGEIEDAVRGLLGEPRTWRAAADLGTAHAEQFAVAWNSLDASSQDGLLPKLIERVTMSRRSGTIALQVLADGVQRLAIDAEPSVIELSTNPNKYR